MENKHSSKASPRPIGPPPGYVAPGYVAPGYDYPIGPPSTSTSPQELNRLYPGHNNLNVNNLPHAVGRRRKNVQFKPHLSSNRIEYLTYLNEFKKLIKSINSISNNNYKDLFVRYNKLIDIINQYEIQQKLPLTIDELNYPQSINSYKLTRNKNKKKIKNNLLRNAHLSYVQRFYNNGSELTKNQLNSYKEKTQSRTARTSHKSSTYKRSKNPKAYISDRTKQIETYFPRNNERLPIKMRSEEL